MNDKSSGTLFERVNVDLAAETERLSEKVKTLFGAELLGINLRFRSLGGLRSMLEAVLHRADLGDIVAPVGPITVDTVAELFEALHVQLETLTYLRRQDASA